MNLTFLEAAAKIQPTPEHLNFKDKVGERYYNLEVLFFTGMVGKSTSKSASFACRCDCGNYTIVKTGNLSSNNPKGIVSCGCVRRAKHKHVPEDTIKQRISEAETKTPYKVVSYGSGAYDCIWTFECNLHGEFSSKWGNVVDKGTRCPTCACISRGFNSMIPGTFYLNELIDSSGDVVAYKFGITNSTVSKRIQWLQMGTSFKVVNVYKFKFFSGADAREMENKFSKRFGKHYLSKEVITTGFSETVSPEFKHEYLKWVTEYTTPASF